MSQNSIERQRSTRSAGFAANTSCPEWLDQVPAAQVRLAVIVGCMAFWAAVGISVISAL
jgi:hypothetical protein